MQNSSSITRGLFIAAIGLAIFNSACSRELGSFEAQRRKTAPQSASSTGLILKEASADDVASLMARYPTAQFREVNGKYGLYEIFGASTAEILKVLPNSRIDKNEFISTYETEIEKDFQTRALASLAQLSANSPAATEEKINPCVESNASPKAILDKVSPKAELELEVIGLNTDIQLSGVNSKANPSHPSKLRFGWVVAPPEGSLSAESVSFGTKLSFKADAYGLYQVLLVVQDERNVCAAEALYLVATGNKEFNANLDENNKKLQELELSKFTHLNEVHAQESWQSGEGEGVLIAVIDSGVNYNHFALAKNIYTFPKEVPNNKVDDDGNGYIDDVVGYDFANSDAFPFDDQGHGSHVAGLAASPKFGLARKAKILSVKALGPKGGDIASIVGGILYAIDNGALVLNMSFGSYGSAHPLLVQALDYAESKGVVVIAAAGNGHPVFGSSINTDITPNFPSALPNENIIAVAAKDSSNVLAPYSNYGKNTVDVVAPGGFGPKELIFSAFLENPKKIEIQGMSGTSMAAPIVSGIAAQMLSRNPRLSALQLKAIMLKSGVEIDALKDLVLSGRYLDAQDAVVKATAPNNFL